jgi:hypothetical protein
MGMQSSLSLTFFFLSPRSCSNRAGGEIGKLALWASAAHNASSQTTLLAINNNRFKFWCCARMWAYAYEAKVHAYITPGGGEG